MKLNPIKNIHALGMHWKTQDPFLFCAHHLDLYPGGNDQLGPNTSLKDRNIGQDFSGKDGWNMYHGTEVPGFPAHPHSGFETVTIVTKGLVDHSDSLGATGRFGEGDAQWLTSGKGVQHAEMFPLLNKDANTLELFQLWLNLPAKSKQVKPYYKMLWREDIPVIISKDKQGKETRLNLIAGAYGSHIALSPTPDSWAANPDNYVQIWTFKMDANASFVIPALDMKVNRSLYFYDGDSFSLASQHIKKNHSLDLDSRIEIQIKNGSEQGYFLFLQGRPINEPVVQYGPFVANSRSELQDTMSLYQKTQFGAWPWPSNEHVLNKNLGRFSKLPNGKQVLK